MRYSLIAFDTDHIKQYVFGTDKLKEIRGASSRLDSLNRVSMEKIAHKYKARMIYANGGSGLFVIDTEPITHPEKHISDFKAEVQQEYHKLTGGGASVTAIDIPVLEPVNDIDNEDISASLEFVQWRLQQEKVRSTSIVTLPSHPFMRPCDACGIRYANASNADRKGHQDSDTDDASDGDEAGEFYCTSCQSKRDRDREVKSFIFRRRGKDSPQYDHLWDHIILSLNKLRYEIPAGTKRPKDFDTFRNFKGAKDYLALVYADGNNMGRALEEYKTLNERKRFAEIIDNATYSAVCSAIAQHLRIADHIKPLEQRPDAAKSSVFPFDILLMGGDDICIVVPASVALDVALTLSQTFHEETQRACVQKDLKRPHTLSVGVVLAPVKYPFGLLQDMAETTLKFAKKAGADARAMLKADDTRINFMIVTGNTTPDFKAFHDITYHRQDDDGHQEFFATLRPYNPQELRELLGAMREKDGANLGRTKLHQIREAVLKMNLTTSVSEGLAVLNNWREAQRNHIIHHIYKFAGNHQMQYSNPDDPVSGFPRVIFPWFKYGTKTYNQNQYTIYRTPLLDFIELYDFVSREGSDNAEGQ